MRRTFVALLVAGVGGCYENPNDTKAESIIRISPDAGTLPGDGYTSTEVQVILDKHASTSKQFTLSCSTGVVNPSAPPGDSTERSIVRNIPPSGTATLRYVAGRTPGTAHIEATAEGQSFVVEYEIATAYPESLELIPTKYRLTADGSDQTSVKVAAYRKFGKPSNGLRANLIACCDDQGEPADCVGLVPLHVPPSTPFDTDSTATFAAVTERLEGTEPQTAWIVATVPGKSPSSADSACERPASMPGGSTRAEARVTLSLLAPTDAGATKDGGTAE